MADLVAEKILALSKALRESGCYPGPKVFTFLKGNGYTSDDFLSRGGWMCILMDMIPNEYPTVDKLIQAIKSVN